jgi:hypothetical protein
MSFADIQSSVTRVAGQQLAPADISALINDCYRTVVRQRQWIGTVRQISFSTYPPYTAGTVSLSTNSATVTGSGTSWTSVLIGRYLHVMNYSPIRVIAVTSATNLTLDQAWGDVSVTGINYEINQNRIVLPADAERILRWTGPTWNLVRQTNFMIDAIDPQRQLHGDPLSFTEVENVGGRIEVELWPIPDQYRLHTITYRRGATTLINPGDTTIVPEELVTKKAQAEAASMLLARSGEQAYASLIQRYELEYQAVLDAAIREDRRMRSPLNNVLDSEDSVNWTSPDWVSAFRQIESFTATRLA